MTTPDTAVQALSDEQIRAICTDAWKSGDGGTLRRIARAAIAADRALRAPPVLAPTFAQLNSACMSYRHDFGLMSDEEQERLRWLAKEWLHAWRKEAAFAAAPKEAPAGAPINQPEAGLRHGRE